VKSRGRGDIDQLFFLFFFHHEKRIPCSFISFRKSRSMRPSEPSGKVIFAETISVAYGVSLIIKILSLSYSVVYYTKKRQDVANYLSTGEENTGLAKEGKMKRSPFYVESDRKTWFLSLGLVKHCETAITNEIARSSTPTLT